jgi:hypothetical protein
MATYRYRFEGRNSGSLEVFVDRGLGRLSGFRRMGPETDFTLRVTVSDSMPWIGLDDVKVGFAFENHGARPVAATVVRSSTNVPGVASD